MDFQESPASVVRAVTWGSAQGGKWPETSQSLQQCLTPVLPNTLPHLSSCHHSFTPHRLMKMEINAGQSISITLSLNSAHVASISHWFVVLAHFSHPTLQKAQQGPCTGWNQCQSHSIQLIGNLCKVPTVAGASFLGAVAVFVPCVLCVFPRSPAPVSASSCFVLCYVCHETPGRNFVVLVGFWWGFLLQVLVCCHC